MSRHPLENTAEEDNIQSILAEQYVQFVSECAVPKAMTLNEIASATTEDKLLPTVIESVKTNKWNKEMRKKNKNYELFFRIREELTVVHIRHHTVLLRGTRLVIPENMHQKVIDIAHESHSG
jgi:hypothetical protein